MISFVFPLATLTNVMIKKLDFLRSDGKCDLLGATFISSLPNLIFLVNKCNITEVTSSSIKIVQIVHSLKTWSEFYN